MKAVVFYVNGTVLNSVTHSSPWLTYQAAKDAAWAYCQELNVWWNSMWVGDIYCDSLSVITDNVHPNDVRSCVIIVDGDDAPLPSFTGFVIEDFAWTSWQNINI
jgi:hypothetical protein